MKKIIKIISLICALIVAVTISACNNPENDYENDTPKQGNEYVSDPNVVQAGYEGSSEPETGYCIAYEIDRTISEESEYIPVQLSYGCVIPECPEGCTKVVVTIKNRDEEQYLLEEISPEEFYTDKYHTYSMVTAVRDKDGNLIEVIYEKTVFTFTGSYQFPSSLCNQEEGYLLFDVDALNDNDEYMTGAHTALYYRKIDREILFQTYLEYQQNKN